MTALETFKRSSDDITSEFTRSMYSFGGIEYFMTEKVFSLQDLCHPFSLTWLWKLGRVESRT